MTNAMGPGEERLPAEVERFREVLREHLPELRERYRVASLGLFGSYVRGEQRPDSDLDVLVEPDEGATLLDLVGIQQDLSDLLGLEVDVAIRRSLKPRIGERILAEVVSL